MGRKKKSADIEAVERGFEQACKELQKLASGARLLLACSAGGDSMTLLDLAARRARRARWELAVVHVDHRQRPESPDEAQFVADQAARRGIECFIEQFPDELVETSPLSEEVMREARYACLCRLAACWEAGAVVLAHQADDRAETFFIRLLAGSGPTGLASIRPVEVVSGLTLVRPLLRVRRRPMRQYLRERGLDWHDDPTNRNQATKRGWVRHTLLPLIHAKIGLDPTGRIVGAAELIEAEAAALGEAARLLLTQIRQSPPTPAMDRLDLTHPVWLDAGPLLRRQLLRQWLWDLRRRAHPPGLRTVGEALTFVEQARPGAELRTIERIHVVHCKGCLLAFGPDVEPPVRQATAAPHLPLRPLKRKKKRSPGRTGRDH